MAAGFRPYVVCWQGILPWNRHLHGEYSAHTKLNLACERARAHCEAWHSFWPTRLPWYEWTVKDIRTGAKLFVIE